MFSRTAIRRLAPVIAAAKRSAPIAVRSFGSSSANAGGPGVKVVWAGFTGLFLFSAVAIARSDGINYDAVKKDISDAIDADEGKRNDGTSMGPTLVRLAWHAAGTYSAVDKTGGSNGAYMRFNPESGWGCNAGLKSARDFLEPIKAKYPGISYADLWTLAGAYYIEKAGGPKIPWRAGRTDSTNGTSVPDGRLPDADKGAPCTNVAHIRAIFGRMGFNDRETVALIGAHAIGRCHTEASGYWGPWTRAETTFSNEFYRLLLEESWTLKTTHNGAKWTGPQQFESKDKSLMMLPNDYALIQDGEFRKIVEIYAKDETAFFKDFSSAFGKLLELGVPFPQQKKGWW